MPTRAQLERPEECGFVWAAGIEDTFIADPWERTGRTLDAYELTDHYAQWATDIDLIGELAVPAARYGVPWHRLNPAPQTWDWDWTDRAIDRFLELGITPIIDLVHYGTPKWLERSFLHPDYALRVAEYASRLAERYRGRLRWYTPMNEPRIAAWYCGMIGWWPPYRRGWRGFLEVMLAACRGIIETTLALRTADPENVALHVDATDLYVAAEPDLEAAAIQRQHLVFLALDLVSGGVDPQHPLYSWLLAHGAHPSELEWFRQHRIGLDLVGLNMYPMFTLKRVQRDKSGQRIRMVPGSGRMVEDLAHLYWERYRRPLMITETAALGSVARRERWLHASVEAVRSLRARGLPLIGYTWWPLFSLVAWAYRQGNRPLERCWLSMGLWEVDPGEGLRRVRTPLVDSYRAMVAAGTAAVGPLLPAASGAIH